MKKTDKLSQDIITIVCGSFAKTIYQNIHDSFEERKEEWITFGEIIEMCEPYLEDDESIRIIADGPLSGTVYFIGSYDKEIKEYGKTRGYNI